MKLKHDFFLLVCKKRKSHEQDPRVCCDQSDLVNVALWNVPSFAISTNANHSTNVMHGADVRIEQTRGLVSEQWSTLTEERGGLLSISTSLFLLGLHFSHFSYRMWIVVFCNPIFFCWVTAGYFCLLHVQFSFHWGWGCSRRRDTKVLFQCRIPTPHCTFCFNIEFISRGDQNAPSKLRIKLYGTRASSRDLPLVDFHFGSQ